MTVIMIFKTILSDFHKMGFSTYWNRIPYNIPYIGGFITYFFLSIGIDSGGFFTKYSSKSLITYETERSFSFASLSRKVFISSVIRKLKDTDFTSFIVVQCNALCVCISNIKIVIYTSHCSTVQCDTYINIMI